MSQPWTDEEKVLCAQALALAESAHVGQFDRRGLPYINHPVRVAEKAQTAACAVVALLHDVLEDSDAAHRDAAHDLLAPYPELLEALFGVTRHMLGHETYRDSIRRALGTSELTREVRLYDLTDNMSPGRMSTSDLRHMAANRYAWAYVLLVTRSEERAWAAKRHAEKCLERTGRLPWEAGA